MTCFSSSEESGSPAQRYDIERDNRDSIGDCARYGLDDKGRFAAWNSHRVPRQASGPPGRRRHRRPAPVTARPSLDKLSRCRRGPRSWRPCPALTASSSREANPTDRASAPTQLSAGSARVRAPKKASSWLAHGLLLSQLMPGVDRSLRTRGHTRHAPERRGKVTGCLEPHGRRDRPDGQTGSRE